MSRAWRWHAGRSSTAGRAAGSKCTFIVRSSSAACGMITSLAKSRAACLNAAWSSVSWKLSPPPAAPLNLRDSIAAGAPRALRLSARLKRIDSIALLLMMSGLSRRLKELENGRIVELEAHTERMCSYVGIEFSRFSKRGKKKQENSPAHRNTQCSCSAAAVGRPLGDAPVGVSSAIGAEGVREVRRGR